MTVGVFGGTFDPFHNGHMGILKFVLDNKVADRVIVAPAGTPRLRGVNQKLHRFNATRWCRSPSQLWKTYRCPK